MLGFLSRLFVPEPKEPPARTPPDGWQCYHASPHLPTEVMIDLIQRSPPCGWPTVPAPKYGLWHEWPVTQKAHRELMARFVASIPPYSGGQGRGIVICSGGWRYFASTYITVRMIRQMGCWLPIELWHLGSLNEFDPKMEWILRDYGPIVWRDANEVAREKGLEPRHLGSQADGYPPWEIKPFSVLHSDFEEVLSLDADSYPVPLESGKRDLETLFGADRTTFWPDGMALPPASAWQVFGLKPPSGPAVESGQLIVNRRRDWKALNLAWFLMEHRDFSFRIPGIYGDKDLWHVAWEYTRTPYKFLWPKPARIIDIYLQMDAKGQTLFVHRTHNKWKLGTESGFKSSQGKTTRVDDRIPQEALAEAWLKELDALVNPRKNFRLRAGTSDEAVWDECVTSNAYELPMRIDGAIVLDVGANIGAFTHAALSRGAEFAYGIEPAPDNIPVLQRNLRRWRDRVKLYYGAAWSSHRRERFVSLAALVNDPRGWRPGGGNWSVGGIAFEGSRTDGPKVTTIRLDTLLKRIHRRHGKPITLKIDCEGGEYPILSTAKHLDKVGAIYGEWHKVTWMSKRWGPDDISAMLEPAGFTVRLGEGDANGMFWATRPVA